MLTQITPKQARIAYKDFGQFRPEALALDLCSDALKESPDPKDCLVLADIMIDKAVQDTENFEEHLGAASSSLDVLMSKTPSAQDSASIIKAHLRGAELDSWHQAFSKDEVNISYEKLLEAAARSLRINRRHPSKRGEQAILQFVPILLGARSIDPTHRWNSRLALDREAAAQKGSGGAVLSHWSVGGARTSKSAGYIDPHFKSQVKARFVSQQINGHRAAGIRAISSWNYGFGEPWDVVRACELEAEGRDGLVRLSGAKLDAMSKKLHGAILNHPKISDMYGITK